MAGSSESYHEPVEDLSDRTRDLHRAITSLREELEAVDWYHQRAEGTRDAELQAILRHNRDDEIEHAMMLLEWLRRNDPVFDKEIGTFLGSEGSIVAIESAAKAGGGGGRPGGARPEAGGSLGIGSLRPTETRP